MYLDTYIIHNNTHILYAYNKLDVGPRWDDDASPMSSYRCM